MVFARGSADQSVLIRMEPRHLSAVHWESKKMHPRASRGAGPSEREGIGACQTYLRALAVLLVCWQAPAQPNVLQ